ncbi:hypothetical protein BT93_B3089 [Corymbia citriodora subsp. variegata]|nr:hypothetical protein BT93_B3089 [Corymbia citriodora subsp. variegata]
MDPRLQLAIENDDVDEQHRLIVEERKFLDRASKDPFPNTPLHVATASRKTQVAMELAILKPWVMMTLDNKLIRIRGQCKITPLHYVAGKEGDIELELLAKFLSACKSSIEDLTNRCETVVHVAIKNHNLKAFKFLFGCFKRVHLTQTLEWKDQDGNTVLHITASEGQSELLIGYTTIKAKNFQGKTALEIFQMNPSGNQDLVNRLHHLGHQAVTPTLSLSQFFSKELIVFEKLLSSLIAAATYQAALTLPGGNWQDDSTNPPDNSTSVTANSSSIALGKPHQAGDAILSGLDLSVYAMCNSLAFFASIAMIWATTFTAEANPLFYIPMPILYVAYFFSLLSQIPEHDRDIECYKCHNFCTAFT